MTDKGPVSTVEARIKGVFQTDHNVTGAQQQVWVPMRLSKAGDVFAVLSDGAGASIIQNVSDGFSNNRSAAMVIPYNSLFNGSTWDRQRANTEETFLASAARTATTNSADFTNFNAKGLHAIIDVSAVTATGSITPIIQGKDPVSGNYYDILQGLPITTVGTNVIKVFPGISAIVNASANDLLPRTYRLRVTHLNAVSMTYSVGGALVI